MIEWAIVKDGEVVNIATGGTRQAAELAAQFLGEGLTVKPLDEVPLAVKRRYRYWSERP